jgi:hypothetical protein
MRTWFTPPCGSHSQARTAMHCPAAPDGHDAAAPASPLLRDERTKLRRGPRSISIPEAHQMRREVAANSCICVSNPDMGSGNGIEIRYAHPIAALVIPVVTNAAKLPPLATANLGENQTTYIFDPAKVTAVALTYSLTVTPKPVRGNSEVNRGPLTPHVWGIAEIPLSINDTPENFLKELQLDTKFTTLHLLSGEPRIRASSIKYIIEPPLQTDRERGAKALAMR